MVKIVTRATAILSSPLFRQTTYIITVAAAAFALVQGSLGRRFRQQAKLGGVLATTMPQRTNAVGVRPGRQAWVFFFGSARCRSCSSPAMKQTISALRAELAAATHGSFDTVRVIGVAVHTDISDGLRYLRSFGNGAFDEISVGSGWENQNITHFTRLFGMTPAAPQLVVVDRSMRASFSPFRMEITADSVLGVLLGYAAIQRWAASKFAFDHLAETSGQKKTPHTSDRGR